MFVGVPYLSRFLLYGIDAAMRINHILHVAVKAKADSCGEQKRKGFQAREKCVSCPIYEGKAYDESPPWGAAAGVESKSGIQAYHTPHETSDS